MTTSLGLSVADIMAGTGLSRGSIYRMACERKWRRYRVDRTVYYHPDDVFGKKAT